MQKPDITSHFDAHTSCHHIWRLFLPIMLPNITVPLIGLVNGAMMRLLNGPAFISGVRLGMMLFNFMYFGLGFLRMGNTSLSAQM